MNRRSLLLFLSAIFTFSLLFSQDKLEPSTMKKPVDVHPDNAKILEEAIVFLKAGNLKIASRDFKGAAQEYTKALGVKSDFKEALKNRGICYTMMNMDSAAVADFNQAISIDPNDPALYSYRGFAKAEMEQFDDALKDLRVAITMDNQFTDAYMNKGIVYIWMQQYDNAIAAFEKIISYDPDNGKAYYNKAIAYEEKGDIPRACLDWRKSFSLKYRLSLEMLGRYCE